MIKRVAQCNCGQLQAECEGEPIRVSVCHCLACKRRTGSAFSRNATFNVGQVRTGGRWSSFSRVTDTGRTNTYHFCRECGSTVFYEVEMRPGTLSVPAGAFADAAVPPPSAEVFPERSVRWCQVSLKDG